MDKTLKIDITDNGIEITEIRSWNGFNRIEVIGILSGIIHEINTDICNEKAKYNAATPTNTNTAE